MQVGEAQGPAELIADHDRLWLKDLVQERMNKVNFIRESRISFIDNVLSTALLWHHLELHAIFDFIMFV